MSIRDRDIDEWFRRLSPWGFGRRTAGEGMFREFEEMQLGLTCNRNAKSFSDSIANLAEDYNSYRESVQRFNPKLRWSNIANDHIEFYSKLLKSYS